MFCKYCGATVDSSNLFCPACGKSLIADGEGKTTHRWIKALIALTVVLALIIGWLLYAAPDLDRYSARPVDGIKAKQNFRGLL